METTETTVKRGRKPVGPIAQTNAQRQRDLRTRRLERIAEVDSTEWTEAECLIVLTSAKFKGKPQRQWAYERLARFI